jgi:hypothetical protein
MIKRVSIARLAIGFVLGAMFLVVLHQSNTRESQLYSSLLSQGAFGNFSAYASTKLIIDCAAVDDLNATECCMGSAGPGAYPGCCAYNPSWCSSSSVSSSSSTDCTIVDDLNATQCCIDIGPPYSGSCCAYNPTWCPSSSSESSDSSSSSDDGSCVSDDDCTDSQHVCCDGYCQMPDQCPSSSSSSSDPNQYCCYEGSCFPFQPAP